MEKGILRRRGLFGTQAFGTGAEILPASEDTLGFIIVHDAEGVGREQLGFTPAVVLRVGGDKFVDFGGVLRTEFACGLELAKLPELFVRPTRRRPSVAQEELHRLEVADVDDPDAVGAVVPSETSVSKLCPKPK